jgi:hypothetical protein
MNSPASEKTFRELTGSRVRLDILQVPGQP